MRRARLPKWNSRLINATGDGYTEVRRYSRAKPIFILSLHAVKRMLSSRKKIEDIRFPRINFAFASEQWMKPIENWIRWNARWNERSHLQDKSIHVIHVHIGAIVVFYRTAIDSSL